MWMSEGRSVRRRDELVSKLAHHLRRLLAGTLLVSGCGSGSDTTPTSTTAPIPDVNPPVETITPSVPCATTLGRFGGLQWQARSEALAGPGPNVWNSCNAWLASDGMHLRVSRVNGVWASAEVYTTDLVGYGRLEFEIATPLNALDPNVVLGLFTYPGGTLDGYHEIDIEFGRFGATAATAKNLNYVVYPSTPPKSARSQCSTRWDSPAESSIHRFLWTASAVRYQSFTAPSITSATIPDRAWTFTPTGSFQISSGAWPLHMNLWLYGGAAPLNGQSQEVVIRRVTYSTTIPATTTPSTTCQ